MVSQSESAAFDLFKDVLVVVADTKTDEPALAMAEHLCARAGGRATALLAVPFPDAAYYADGYSGQALWGPVVEQLQTQAREELTRLQARAVRASIPVETRWTASETFLTRQIVTMSARHADITILTQPRGEMDVHFRRQLIEAALFDSGRPTLITPVGWSKPPEFKKVVVAWNASREAARAVGDAASILNRAAVTIVTVDASPGVMGAGEAPGEDVAAHLARRGVSVEVRNIDSAGRTDACAIAETAADVGADLIVLGAYGHSRMRELVFGGVTRELLDSSKTPLFLSH